jgi:hypothetical protein
MKAETIAKALGGRTAGAGWMARSPAHDDHEPSDDGAQGQRHADINSGSTATATAQQPRTRQPSEFKKGDGDSGSHRPLEDRLMGAEPRRRLAGPIYLRLS